MNDLAHGQQRAGLITASVAKVIMSGGEQAWNTLCRNLWADDGTEFAQASTGARAHGHEQEGPGAAKYWSDNPDIDLEPGGFIMYEGVNTRWHGLIGASPDRRIVNASTRTFIRGLEVKSPVEFDTYMGISMHCQQHAQPPPEHLDQVYFSMLVSGKPWTYLVHHGKEYTALTVARGNVRNTGWLDRFTPRLDAFLDLYLAGKAPKRDKLAADKLKGLRL